MHMQDAPYGWGSLIGRAVGQGLGRGFEWPAGGNPIGGKITLFHHAIVLGPKPGDNPGLGAADQKSLIVEFDTDVAISQTAIACGIVADQSKLEQECAPAFQHGATNPRKRLILAKIKEKFDDAFGFLVHRNVGKCWGHSAPVWRECGF